MMLIRNNDIERIDFNSLKIFDYSAGAETGSSVAVIEVPVGVAHPRAYSQRSDKYYLVMNGEIDFCLGDEEFHLGPRDFCFVEQGVEFSYVNNSESEAVLVLVHTPSFDLEAETFVAAVEN